MRPYYLLILSVFIISLKINAQDSTNSIIPIEGDRFATFSFMLFQNSSSTNGEIRKYKKDKFITYGLGAKIPAYQTEKTSDGKNIEITNSQTNRSFWVSIAANTRKHIASNFEAYYGFRHSININHDKIINNIELEADTNYTIFTTDSAITFSKKHDYRETINTSNIWGYQLSPQIGFNYYITKQIAFGGKISMHGLIFSKSYGRKTETDTVASDHFGQIKSENDNGSFQSFSLNFNTFSSLSFSFQF